MIRTTAPMTSGRGAAHRSGTRRAERLYVWIVGSLLLGTATLSLLDMYLLVSLTAG